MRGSISRMREPWNSHHTTDVNFPTVAIYDDGETIWTSVRNGIRNGEIITATVHANNRYRWRQAARENQLDSNRSFVLTLSGGFVDDKLRLRVISSPRCVFITISESECAMWISKYLRKFETIRILSQTGLTVFNHDLFPVANASFAWSFILNYYILRVILIINVWL